MSGLPRVFVVDDDRMLHKVLIMKLGRGMTILSAHTLGEARNLFAAYPDIRLIVLDGCLLRSSLQAKMPDTLPLVGEFRKTFRGPIVAASSNPNFRQMMMGAGCDHECEDKDLLAQVIERLVDGPACSVSEVVEKGVR